MLLISPTWEDDPMWKPAKVLQQLVRMQMMSRRTPNSRVAATCQQGKYIENMVKAINMSLLLMPSAIFSGIRHAVLCPVPRGMRCKPSCPGVTWHWRPAPGVWGFSAQLRSMDSGSFRSFWTGPNEAPKVLPIIEMNSIPDYFVIKVLNFLVHDRLFIFWSYVCNYINIYTHTVHHCTHNLNRFCIP